MKTLYYSIIMVVVIIGFLVITPNVFADNTINTLQWHKYYYLGKFDHVFPTKPDQIFVIQYKTSNGSVEKIMGVPDTNLRFYAQSADSGLLVIKFPRNYPFSDENWNYPTYVNSILTIVNDEPVQSKPITTDCFFVYSFPFSRNSKIDLAFMSILQFTPHHGDDLSPNCNHQTTEYIPPLKQVQAGILPMNVKCDKGFDVLLNPDNKTISCIKSSNAEKLLERGKWSRPVLLTNIHVNPKIVLYNSSYGRIDKKNDTLVTINNDTYYQTTLLYPVDDLKYGTVVKFQNVTFSFPNGLMRTIEGGMTTLDIKFQDGAEEIYEKIPTRYGPVANNDVTVLSNHVMPQAGLTYYNGEIKLLVSKENNSSVNH